MRTQPSIATIGAAVAILAGITTADLRPAGRDTGTAASNTPESARDHDGTRLKLSQGACGRRGCP